jgi:uncharacterized protein involved in exopolysaccharide biosynthesis
VVRAEYKDAQLNYDHAQKLLKQMQEKLVYAQRQNPAASDLAELKKAIREQEDVAEDAGKMLANIIKAKSIIYTGSTAPSEGQAALEAEKHWLESQLASLSKLAGEQLFAFAAGLEVPDNAVRPLYPKYLDRKKDLEGLRALGLGTDHPTVRERTQEVEEIRKQLDAGLVALNDALRARLDLINAQLERARAASRSAATASSPAAAGFRAEQARLEAQLKALSTLAGEALYLFAANLDLTTNPVPELHRRLIETQLEIADLRATGLADDHPKVVARTKHLKVLQQQLQTTVDALKDTLRAKLTVTEAQLNAASKSR